MIIWLYCIFSNEEKLLPFFLQHYALIADRLIMLDNCSTDRGPDLIRNYPNATIERYPAEQAEMDSIRAAQFAAQKYQEARGKADWVIWVDCDEFLWNGAIDLRETLRGYRAQNIRAVRPQGYQMLADGFPETNVPLIEQVRYGVRDPEYDKVSMFDPAINIYWRPGRHNCTIDDVTAYQCSIRLLHYRYLGAEYFEQRNAYLEANRSTAERQARRSYHVAPDYISGKYSAAWYQQARSRASDVIVIEQAGVVNGIS